MCLAVPGRIEALFQEQGLPMAKVDFGGVKKDICLAYLPDARIGDYAIVHVGFAISRLDEDAARATLQTFAELGVLQESLAEWQSMSETPTDDPTKWPQAGRSIETSVPRTDAQAPRSTESNRPIGQCSTDDGGRQPGDRA
jgi:hydrogenase expression/formation protein HypC